MSELEGGYLEALAASSSFFGSSGASAPGTGSGKKRVRVSHIPCEHPGCVFLAATKSKLQRHSLTHTGEKPFPCPFPGCNYAGAEKSTVKKHVAARHKGWVQPGEEAAGAARAAAAGAIAGAEGVAGLLAEEHLGMHLAELGGQRS